MLRAIEPRVRVAPVLLTVLLTAALVLQAYRYPFQINSSTTSPTYADTPAWLQYGKWGVVAALALALFLVQLPGLGNAVRTLSRAQWTVIALQTVVLGGSIVVLIRTRSSTEPAITALVSATGLVVALMSSRGLVHGRWLTRALLVYAAAALLVDLGQVVLFLAVGRLPALAYAASPAVRFGSILDDPNGFAVLLAALIAASWYGLRGRPNVRIVLVVGLVCCVPLTQSWTGIVSTTAALALTWAFLVRSGRRDARRAIALILIGLLVAGTAAFFARSTIAELIALKHGSVVAHSGSLQYLAPTSPDQPPSNAGDGATGTTSSQQADTAPSSDVSPTPQSAPSSVAQAPSSGGRTAWHGAESALVNILVNYGWIVLVAYVALGIMSAWLLLRRSSGLPLALRAAGAAYLVSYLIACLNLGLDRTFPCNLLFFVVSALAACRDPAVPTRLNGSRESLWSALRRVVRDPSAHIAERRTRTSVR